jgi:uncharacterized membrane protein YeaQ/YmgE (transglycosylase-associated protein family)
MELLWLALVGLVAGWLAGFIVKGGGLGLIGNLVVGVIGAFVGDWLLRGVLEISIGSGMTGSIITATIGAIVLLLVVGLFTGRK